MSCGSAGENCGLGKEILGNPGIAGACGDGSFGRGGTKDGSAGEKLGAAKAMPGSPGVPICGRFGSFGIFGRIPGKDGVKPASAIPQLIARPKGEI